MKTLARSKTCKCSKEIAFYITKNNGLVASHLFLRPRCPQAMLDPESFAAALCDAASTDEVSARLLQRVLDPLRCPRGWRRYRTPSVRARLCRRHGQKFLHTWSPCLCSRPFSYGWFVRHDPTCPDRQGVDKEAVSGEDAEDNCDAVV